MRSKGDLKLELVRNALLEKLGYDKMYRPGAVGLTAGEWVKARVKVNIAKYPDAKNGKVGNKQEISGGVKAKYYD